MQSNYFNSSVITPLVKASSQNSAFANGDIVFDWTAFDIPRGASRLIGATITTRHNKVASGVAPIDLIFAKDDGTNTTPTTIGSGNALLGVSSFERTDVIGFLPGSLSDMSGEGATATAVTYQTTEPTAGLILESSSNSGGTKGTDRYYIGGLAGGALDLQSLVALDDDVDISGNSGTINTLDGTAPNVVFAVGDILHVQDDIILGEVASLNANDLVFKFDGSTSTNHAVVAGNQSYTVPADIAAWRIQNGAGAAGDLTDDDLVYNIYPLRIILHFEK